MIYDLQYNIVKDINREALRRFFKCVKYAHANFSNSSDESTNIDYTE